MTRVFLGVAALVASLSGCTSAQVVSKDPTTGIGVVSIPENTDVWPTHYRQAALALIEKDTGPNPERYIIQEGVVVVGKKTNNNQQVNSDPSFNRQTVMATTTTTDVTQYQITYRKRAMPGLPTGLPGANGMQQTQFMQGPGGVAGPGGMAGSGVQPAGGIVPNVGPGGGMYPAGGVPGNAITYPSR
jgi:hypothetical protein